MAKRPAHGRGSGGRVPPAPRTTASSGSGRSGRARVLQADERRTKAKAGAAKGPGGAPVKGPVPGAAKAPAGEPAADGAAPRTGFSFRQLFDPNGTSTGERIRPWWGFGDVIAWFLVAQVLNLVFSLMVASWAGYALDRPTGIGSPGGARFGRGAPPPAPR